MRLKITHDVTCTFSHAATGSIQTVRMEPRGLAGQFVESWQLNVSADCLLKPVIDPYGNVTYTFSVPGPLVGLTIIASGTVMTEDTVGVVRGASERLPIAVYRRDTDYTHPTPEIRDLAATIAAVDGPGAHAVVHALMKRLHETIRCEPSHDRTPMTAAEVLASREGGSEGLAHLFIAACRSLGIPTRYVSGYLYEDHHEADALTVHGWAESWVEGFGWIGFDCTRNICPSENYVRLASGLDCIDALPIRISPYGATVESIDHTILVDRLEDF